MDQTKIGFSAFVISEDAYLYSGDSCYVFDNKESLIKTASNYGYTKSEIKIDEISFEQIMDDFGVSCGDYVIESDAFNKFVYIAKAQKISFESEEDDDNENFTKLEI